MFRFFLTALFVNLASASASVHALSDAADFAPLDEQNYDLSRESVQQLLCRDRETGILYLSRAVALAYWPESGSHDVLLATRHAVFGPTGRRDCRIRGVDERVGEIVRVEAGEPDARDPTDFTQDWAILRTRRRLPEDVPRVGILIGSNEGQGELTLLLRAVERAPCHLPDPPESLRDPSLIVHDCATRGGLSGSPLVTQIGGAPYVVGLHVGQYLLIDEERRDYGIARRLDGDFLAALVDFLDEETSD